MPDDFITADHLKPGECGYLAPGTGCGLDGQLVMMTAAQGLVVGVTHATYWTAALAKTLRVKRVGRLKQTGYSTLAVVP